MKGFKKICTAVLASAMTFSMVGCSSGSGKNSGSTADSNGLDTSKTVKIGVLVSDATSAEALAFRSYYEDYIQKNYNVEFMYSDELKDAAGEKSAIDNLITNNAKAIISLSSFDRPAQIDQCASADVYYAVATGTLTDEQYDTYKSEPYYVGAIGPDLQTEYQTGYDMAKHYLDAGDTEFAIFGGAVPYYTDMHIYRVAGMIAAMCDATGGDYKGNKDEEGIVGQIYKDGAIDTGAIGDVNILGYVGGYDMDDAWFAKCSEMAKTPGLQVILAVGNGSDFFATGVQGTDVKIASVDAYADSYADAFDSGVLDYLAGKFAASIGPIFIATYSAVLGKPIRDNDGNALALSQGYWVATNADEFHKYLDANSNMDDPVYDKKKLDPLLGSDYDTFKKFVEAYSFEEVTK